ncbi:MAG: class I SAM-dependent methyltransferase [Actinomycetota bacterium]
MRAGSFGGTASDYERGRAHYPDEAVQWLVEGANRVVDLGAGTGKLTGALSRHSSEVLALEPQHQMLLHLRRAAPYALVACSAAESLPVRSGWAEAVVVAQAFHWFDQQRAVPAIRQIMSPGGRLGLIWNVRDETVGWVAELARIAGPENSLETRSRLDQLPGFEPFELRTWHTTQEMDRATLLAHVRSRSNVAAMSERDRQRALDRIAHLCDTHPDLTGRESFALPYETQAFRAQLA